MSFNQSLLIPATLKTLTLANPVSGGPTTVTIAPGAIMSAATESSGTKIIFLDRFKATETIHVTDAIATVVANTNLFLVTTTRGSKYIRTDTVKQVAENGSGSILFLMSDDQSASPATLQSTDAPSVITARIASAAVGGVGQQVTAGTTQTQAGGTVINQSSVNVVTVATAGNAITLSDAQPLVIMTNSAANWAKVFPPVGSQINTCATNKEVRLLGHSVVLFRRVSTTSWVYEILAQSAQAYASAATGSATVITGEVARATVTTPGNCFVQYGDSATGEIPAKVSLSNLDGANLLKVKFAGDFVDAVSGVAITSPYEVPANTTVDMAYDGATGKVVVSGANSIKVTATLVAGSKTFNTAAIGATAAAKIVATSTFRRTGITAVNGGTLATEFRLTNVVGASLKIDAYDAAGAALATDVSSITGEIVF